MEIRKYETREEWLADRVGKVTGSRLAKIVSVGGPTKEMICAVLDEHGVEYKKADKKEVLEALLTPEDNQKLFTQLPKKIGFYELIAEQLGLPPDGEDPMERGSRLEAECMERFSKETGKTLDTSLVMWVREEDGRIAASPDASVIGEPAAVEGKCLGSARHIEAWHTKQIPSEYNFQKLQYFIVNDELQTLYFCFYDPRIPAIDFFFIEVQRAEIQAEIDEYLAYQRNTLAEVSTIVNQLTF